MNSLNNALDRNIAPAAPGTPVPAGADIPVAADNCEYTRGLMDFYYGRAAGPWWGIAMDQALNVSGMLTEGGGFLQPTEQEAAAVAMMTAHIQYDLRAALAMEGVGSDAGFKCVGKVVAECAAKLGKPDWMTRAGGAMFPALDPMRLRDQMRSQVRQRLSTQYPNRDIRYEGGREAIISHDLDYLRKNCGAN